MVALFCLTVPKFCACTNTPLPFSVLRMKGFFFETCRRYEILNTCPTEGVSSAIHNSTCNSRKVDCPEKENARGSAWKQRTERKRASLPTSSPKVTRTFVETSPDLGKRAGSCSLDEGKLWFPTRNAGKGERRKAGRLPRFVGEEENEIREWWS